MDVFPKSYVFRNTLYLLPVFVIYHLTSRSVLRCDAGVPREPRRADHGRPQQRQERRHARIQAQPQFLE